MQIIVERAPGDKQGPDITDSLLTTLPVMLERGRQMLDRHSKQIPIDIDCKYLPDVRCGQLCRITDADLGPVRIGKITSVRHTATIGGAVTSLTVLVPE